MRYLNVACRFKLAAERRDFQLLTIFCKKFYHRCLIGSQNILLQKFEKLKYLNIVNNRVKEVIYKKLMDCEILALQSKTSNATYCNNHDDLLHLSFIWKISLFSDAYLEPSQASMMEPFLQRY